MGNNELDRQNTAKQVLMDMRRNIFLQKYNAGETVSEACIAEKYDVSRSTVRLVFNQLISDGLMIQKPNGRKEIRPLDQKFLEDICLTRSMIECEAANIILNKSNNDFSGLMQTVAGFYSCTQMEDKVLQREKLIELNDSFHDRMLVMTENIPLIQCYRTISPLISTIVSFNVMLDLAMNDHGFYKSHNEITQMLMNKDRAVVEYVHYHALDATLKDLFNALSSIKD